MPASAKTSYLAEQSILRFCSNHEAVFYWTFTFEQNVVEKSEAERRFRPLKDLLRRREAHYLHFWERQSRGAWHVHMLVNIYIDVTWLRPWLVERGWGPIMKVIKVEHRGFHAGKYGWVVDDRNIRRLVWYLRKYLTKSLEESTGKKKAFGGSVSARAGTTRFKWLPQFHPTAYLYYYGAQAYRELWGPVVPLGAIALCVRMGYELTNWCAQDPWLFDGFV